jgi:signal peptidase I
MDQQEVENQQDETPFPDRRYSTTLIGIVNTVQWILIALILAFVFRAFVMEQFRIPTGSMAETLRGVHFHLRCLRCGYKYDVDRGSISGRCPSCNYYLEPEEVVGISNGDRIFVDKCSYYFFEPKRWDVIVFKNPLNPKENYIKRLIALPNETIEIIDGDVYINNSIARKPPGVQGELWMPIFDNDFQASGRAAGESDPPEMLMGNTPRTQPFVNKSDSSWDTGAGGGMIFRLDSKDEKLHTIAYDGDLPKDFRAKYSYNSGSQYLVRPVCSDLMIRFFAGVDAQGLVGAMLRKYGREYIATVDSAGKMTIETVDGDERRSLASSRMPVVNGGDAAEFSFANIDHELIFSFGDSTLRYDLGGGPDDVGDISRSVEVGVEIFGKGKVDLYHVSILRDVHYLSDTILRAGPGQPFSLGKDEYFACGDNSPASFDCRLWATEGKGNDGITYPKGIIPRDYLIGKAFFLYWGDAFKPVQHIMPVVPNLSQIKPIYGGKEGY